MVTVITKTIDASGGGDYTSFTAAEAAVPTLGTSTDLVANDEAIVFECVAGTYDETVTLSGGLTTDATRNVTYRAAAGSEHGGVFGAGVNIESDDAGYGSVLEIRDSFTVLEGLCVQATNPSTGSRTACDLRPLGADLEGIQLRNMLLSTGSSRQVLGTATGYSFGSAAAPLVFENCVIHRGAGSGTAVNVPVSGTDVSYVEFINTTIVGTATGTRFIDSYVDAGATINVSFVNCLNLLESTARLSGFGPGTHTVTGSNNVGGASEAFPSALRAESQTWTFTTDTTAASTGSQAIYDDTTGKLINVPGNDAIGVGTATGAPTTDITGAARIRSTFSDPGAFTAEFLTLTKSIDAGSNGDYTTFTAAEGATSTFLPTDNLIQRNTAIVFEAEAGTYEEEVNFQSSITSDATRNVTYKAAAGSGHGGVFGAGVVLLTSGGGYGSTQTIRDNFLTLDGIECRASDTSSFRHTLKLEVVSDLLGVTVRNCLLWSQTNRACFQSAPAGNYDQGSAAAPIVIENCVLRSTDNVKDMLVASERPGYEMYLRVINCSFIGDSTGNHRAFNVGGTSSTNYELSNNLILVPAGWYQSTSTYTLTGGSNVSGPTQALPSAIQAESQTWTFSTDTTAVSTGSQAIYDSATGRLWDVAGNDAWNILTDLTNVPALGLTGVARQASGFNPGAFEVGALLPPTAVSSPSPTDAATNVANDVDLTWTDGAHSPTAWAVYLSAAGPTFTGANLISSSASPADPGTLAYGTTYYWRVDQTNAAGTTTGAVFSFTTETEPVAIGVWDAPMSEHTTAGSFGEALQQMKIAVTSLAASRLSP
jgi:hypothetical protein